MIPEVLAFVVKQKPANDVKQERLVVIPCDCPTIRVTRDSKGDTVDLQKASLLIAECFGAKVTGHFIYKGDDYLTATKLEN